MNHAPQPRENAITDFQTSFRTWCGEDIKVEVPSGKSYIRVTVGEAVTTFSKEDVCRLRFALGKGLRMGFGIYAD